MAAGFKNDDCAKQNMAVVHTLDSSEVDNDEHKVIVSLNEKGGLAIMYGASSTELDRGSMLDLYPSEARDLLRLLIKQFPLDALSDV